VDAHRLVGVQGAVWQPNGLKKRTQGECSDGERRDGRFRLVHGQCVARRGAVGARLLGIDDEMKIFMIAFASFFPVLLNTYSGVRSVDPVQLQTARTFGVAGWKLLWQIVLPASSPYIFTGMRVSLAVALIVMVISEMVAASSGIGYFILSAQRGFKIREMFAGVLTLAALGYVLNRLFLAIENRVLAWHYGYTQ